MSIDTRGHATSQGNGWTVAAPTGTAAAEGSMSSPPTSSPRDGATDVLAAGRLLADMLQSAPGSASLAVDRLAAAGEAAEAGFSGYVQSRFAAVEESRAGGADPAAAEAGD